MLTNTEPQINNLQANHRFTALARDLGLDPSNQWVGGYVAYEWEHGRHIVASRCPDLSHKQVLEFGCNFGATAIVLAHLGAHVTAIDVNPDYVTLARANVARYGLEANIGLHHIPDTKQLPFADASFDIVTANSVLEYVPHSDLQGVQAEITRVLKTNGLIMVTGTSNRLWPKEMHSRRWLVNYTPRVFDALLFPGSHIERGLFPWEVTKGFTRYATFINEDLVDHGSTYRHTRYKLGVHSLQLGILSTVASLLHPLGISAGMLTPSLSVTLRKL